MSDSYYQFALEADKLTKEEAKWLGSILKQQPGSLFLIAELGIDEGHAQDWDPFPDFEYAFGPTGDSIRFYSEESGSLLQVAHIVHVMMKKFNKDGFYRFSSSATSSKMEIDQFGGDMVWVTKYGCLWSMAIENLIDKALESGLDHKLESKKGVPFTLVFEWDKKRKEKACQEVM